MNTAHCTLLKKISALVLALACVFAFAACSASSDGGASATPSGNVPADNGADSGSVPAERITITPGVLKVGMEIAYPPMEYLEEDGVTPTGFDYDLSLELGKKLGLSVETVDTGWDAIFSSLDSERYDVIISSVSITESRQENYNLTKPYIANNIVLVASAGSDIADLVDLEGKRVGTQTDTTADDNMQTLQADGGITMDYHVYDKILDSFNELKTDRIDVVCVDKVVALYYLQTYDDLEIVWESDSPEPLGMCLKKGNDALTNAIETAVDELYADGTIATLANKYFGTDITAGVR
jgi:polar amino acid transport system substrate-binding protein